MGDWTKGLLKARGRFVDATGSVDTWDGPVSSSIIVCEETSANDGEGRVWTTSGTPEANAERIIACWNAMTGIPDPAATMKEVVEVLRKIPSALNSEFSAGCEEREGGSARRQERLLRPGIEIREEVRALLAKLEGK